MIDQEMLKAIGEVVEGIVDRKLEPINKSIEALQVAVLGIDADIKEIKRDIKDMTNVIARNCYEIELLKTRGA